jgi:hypothetical protein
MARCTGLQIVDESRSTIPSSRQLQRLGSFDSLSCVTYFCTLEMSEAQGYPADMVL